MFKLGTDFGTIDLFGPGTPQKEETLKGGVSLADGSVWRQSTSEPLLGARVSRMQFDENRAVLGAQWVPLDCAQAQARWEVEHPMISCFMAPCPSSPPFPGCKNPICSVHAAKPVPVPAAAPVILALPPVASRPSEPCLSNTTKNVLASGLGGGVGWLVSGKLAKGLVAKVAGSALGVLAGLGIRKMMRTKYKKGDVLTEPGLLVWQNSQGTLRAYAEQVGLGLDEYELFVTHAGSRSEGWAIRVL